MWVFVLFYCIGTLSFSFLYHLIYYEFLIVIYFAQPNILNKDAKRLVYMFSFSFEFGEQNYVNTYFLFRVSHRLHLHESKLTLKQTYKPTKVIIYHCLFWFEAVLAILQTTFEPAFKPTFKPKPCIRNVLHWTQVWFEGGLKVVWSGLRPIRLNYFKKLKIKCRIDLSWFEAWFEG